MSSQPEHEKTEWRILVATPESAVIDFPALRQLTVDPFDQPRLDLLQDLSKALLAHPRLKRNPAGVALGFWLRRAHLADLAAGYSSRATDGIRMPAGLVLHITPANVDTMFMLSWVVSFLAGNANIVRLTSRLSPLMEDILDCVRGAFDRHTMAAAGNLFVTYEHNDALTARISAVCDQRIVWGGDETVGRLRAVPLNPHAGERAFASKRSFSVIGQRAFAQATDAEHQQLAERMAADILPFGQMACSSPHCVYWLGGPNPFGEIVPQFAARLEAVLEARREEADFPAAVRRMTTAFALAATGCAERAELRPNSANLTTRNPANAEQGDPCGANLLIHTSCASLSELAGLMRPDHQTITYFGLGEHELSQLARIAGRSGVDRIVPIGRALDFAPVWDGYDLWSDLTRIVTVVK